MVRYLQQYGPVAARDGRLPPTGERVRNRKRVLPVRMVGVHDGRGRGAVPGLAGGRRRTMATLANRSTAPDLGHSPAGAARVIIAEVRPHLHCGRYAIKRIV